VVFFSSSYYPPPLFFGAVDIMPTFAGMAGIDLAPYSLELDGVDNMAAIESSGGESSRSSFLYNVNSDKGAVRGGARGQYKLYRGRSVPTVMELAPEFKFCDWVATFWKF
jgi:hypothetical protein